MRILIHYHAYGDAAKVPALVAEHSEHIRKQIDSREDDEVGRLQAEYQMHANKLAALNAEIAAARALQYAAKTKSDRIAADKTLAKHERPREKVAAKLAERDERIAEARRRAESDRDDVAKVGEELFALYGDPDELLKHARVVQLDEVSENEFNLNIPRYVDTFEPEPRMEVKDALIALAKAEKTAQDAESQLRKLLKGAGYAH